LYLDYTLTHRIIGFVSGVGHKLYDKLEANRLEAYPKNFVLLLAQPGIDKLLEYTSESMNRSGARSVNRAEFIRFIGTILFSSCFTLSINDSFSVMNSLSNGGVMKQDRFKEILCHLKGFCSGSQNSLALSHTWDDQRNLLKNLHPLETRMFERSVCFFFDSINGAYVYDDELIASKAKDVELRTLSDRKTGGEGPTVDCLCDSFFHFVISMQLRTKDDSQLENCVKVLEGLPEVEPNANSPDGPIIVFDRGYGKKKMVDVVQSKNFKLITVAATVGSEHPIVPSSAVAIYRERLLKNTSLPKDILANSLSEFDTKIQPWVISDDPNILLGPELKMCMHSSDNNLCALAVRDIFEKKISQKVLRFFSYGMKETAFPNANEWLGVLKTGEKDQFGTPFNKREFSDLDNLLR